MMMKRFPVSVLTLALLALASLNVHAQSAANDPLQMLPASDAVMYVEAKRVLTETLPRALANDAARLAQINADIDRFKQQTGIDARSFDRIAVATRYGKAVSGATTMEPVAVARGTFNAGTIVAMMRLASKGKYTEQKYGGKTVYTFTLNEQMKMFGLLKMRITEASFVALDNSTLAFGTPEMTRAAVDSHAGKGRVSAELIQMTTRNAGALAAFGGTVPASAAQDLNFGNEEVTRSIRSIKYVFGALGQTANGYDMQTTMRTGTAEEATSLNDTINAVRSLSGMLTDYLKGDRKTLAENAFKTLQVTKQNNDVQIRLEVAQSDLATILRGL